MHAMDASGEERHSCKHHGLLDQWLLNSNGRHNNCSSNNNNNNTASTRSDPDVSKPDHPAEGSLVPYEEEERELENGDSIFGSLTKIVQASNENIVLQMAKPSCSLLDKMDAHMDNPLIDNLKLTVSK